MIERYNADHAARLVEVREAEVSVQNLCTTDSSNTISETYAEFL